MTVLLDDSVEADIHTISKAVSKPASDWTTDKIVSTSVSALALCLSVGTIVYTRRKDSKSRHQSIADEYWLRKIVSPMAVEPLIKWFLEVLQTLPADCSARPPSATDTATVYAAFLVKFQSEKNAHAGNIIICKQLGAQLYDNVADTLNDVEDAVAEYCAANDAGQLNASANPAYPRAATLSVIQDAIQKTTGEIQVFQKTM